MVLSNIECCLVVVWALSGIVLGFVVDLSSNSDWLLKAETVKLIQDEGPRVKSKTVVILE